MADENIKFDFTGGPETPRIAVGDPFAYDPTVEDLLRQAFAAGQMATAADEGLRGVPANTPTDYEDWRAEAFGGSVDTADVSDGFHTFAELYRHRTALFALFCRLRPDLSWRSRQHDDPDAQPMFSGMFIAGAQLPVGRHVEQVTYHCENETWDWFEGVPVLDRAPAWDGHTSDEVVERLNRFWRLNP